MQALIPVHIDDVVTLRAKIIDRCGFTCTFCHNEGTPVTADNRRRSPLDFTATGPSGRVSIYTGSNGARFLSAPFPAAPDFGAVLHELGTALGAVELHLTGGEPTLHSRLDELVGTAASGGLRVCMTSNGERGEAVIASCAAAGLHRINFSVFGTTAAELAEVQDARYRSAALADRKIAALHRSVALCEEHGVHASANIVVPGADHAIRVHRLLDEFSPYLSVRLLNSLDHGTASVDAIHAVLRDRDAVATAHHMTAGVSGARTSYRLPEGRTVFFKQIRTVRLPDTCTSCRYNNSPDCQEGFYGVRLYYDTDQQWQVGVCIQRMDLCLPLHEFLSGPLPEEIRKLRRTERRQLAARYPHATLRR